jgi:hypothetical protein
MNKYKKHKPIGIKFRLDLLMVKQLKKEARERDTSMNAEIRRRLQWSFDYDEWRTLHDNPIISPELAAPKLENQKA